MGPTFLPLPRACPSATGRDVLEPQGPQNLRNGADATGLFWTSLDLLDLNLISSSQALIPGQAGLTPVLLDQCMGSPWGGLVTIAHAFSALLSIPSPPRAPASLYFHSQLPSYTLMETARTHFACKLGQQEVLKSSVISPQPLTSDYRMLTHK